MFRSEICVRVLVSALMLNGVAHGGPESIARNAKVNVSSQFNDQYAGRLVVDGIIGLRDSGEWAAGSLEESGLSDRMRRVEKKQEAVKSIEKFFREHSVTTDQVNGFLDSKNSSRIKHQVKLHGILLRPHVGITDLKELLPEVDAFLAPYEPLDQSGAEINMKYEGYIRKEQEMVDKMNRLEKVRIEEGFDFHQLNAISAEAREKLSKVKPRTIGQASRISGVTPADVSVLLVYMGR